MRHRSMVTVGPKPHEEAALGPGPSPGRLGDGVQQQPAGAEQVVEQPAPGMAHRPDARIPEEAQPFIQLFIVS